MALTPKDPRPLLDFFKSKAPTALKIVIALAIAAVAIAYIITHNPGCMTTTDIDGKKYSVRLDSLTPIQATTGPASGVHPPIHIHLPAPAAPQPTTQRSK